MATTSVLDSVACGLRTPAIRLIWASRDMRSFSTTLRVHKPPKSKSRHRLPIPRAFDRRDKARVRKFIKAAQGSFPEQNGLDKDKFRIQRIVPPETSPSANSRDGSNETALDNGNRDCDVAQDPAVPEHEIANDDPFSKLKQEAYRGEQQIVPWRDRMGPLSQALLLEQDFHSLLHEGLLKKIMLHRAVRRGMPVHDTTYEAVRSRRNLFIKTARPVRSLQYLLPAVQSILDFGVLRRRDRPRKVERGARLAVRPLSLLVLCPTLGQAEEVQAMCTTLLHGYNSGICVASLNMPSPKSVSALGDQGYHVLSSTPEHITQWLGMPKAKAVLTEALQDVEMLVVDGKASALRGAEFRELMQGIMEDALLPGDTQRIITSDKFDPKLDESLAKLVLRGDYDLYEDQRLEEIQEMQRAQDDAIKRIGNSRLQISTRRDEERRRNVVNVYGYRKFYMK